MNSGRVCCRCREFTESPVLVAIPFANSGPAGPATYACLPCARIYATSPLSPDWIVDEIDKTQARQATVDSRRDPRPVAGRATSPVLPATGRPETQATQTPARRRRDLVTSSHGEPQ